MTINQNSIRAGIPGGVWWLTALSALLMLCLVTVLAEQKPIETDLKNRVIEDMAANNIDWVSVELEGGSRDVLLTGIAPSTTSRDLAIKVAGSVYGVSNVHDQTKFGSSLLSSELSIERQGNQVLLRGRLESQASIDTVVKATKDTFGDGNVTNELVVSSEVKAANWLTAYAQLLPSLLRVETVSLEISDSKSLLIAEASSHGERIMLASQARRWLGKKLDSRVIVVDASEPNVVSISNVDGVS